MNKRMKKVVMILGSLVGILVVSIIGVIVWLSSNLDALETVELNNATLATLEDGTYTGVCDEGRWSVEVIVTVEGGISSITLLEDVSIPEEGVFEQVKSEVIDHESLDVDAVSGATLTSNAYLTAIDDALEEAKHE